LVKLDQDQEWVGYFQLQEGSADPSITGKNPLQIKRFYVDALHHGQGVAFAMMNEVIRLSQTKKFQTLWLGVWESNDRAIAFYRKWGFLEVGDIIFYVGTDPQRDLILQKLL
jgi:ribosomal protein S18 acetylase RimI-like enzyme